jgi:hypothetical protein
VAAIAALILSHRTQRGGGYWVALSIMALLLAISAWVAIQTGQAQEGVVETVVSEPLIHGHEEAAEGLLVGATLAAVVILLGLIPGRLGTGARFLSIPVAFVVLGLTVQVGRSGGELVYSHGAATAYLELQGTTAPQFPEAEPRGRERAESERRHDQGERR